ncbi:hypothetical protein [Cytobacillus oceanisediminis]|uniref:hypothetical protein n=1 Tax=Cytobacillus oceanisediminis TaxID=665099 RepID=UPI00207A124B|nr:hypothetical protein [Cytobacillus oceanisediminis]USK44119.1 hypothetical protein LIT27_26745 [Cytobacillus oceanisediminis]
MISEKLKIKKLDIEKYNFAYINCFVRPITMEVERLIPGGSNYFISIYNLTKSFTNLIFNYDYRMSRVEGYKVNPDHFHEVTMLNKVLRDYFGLELRCLSTKQNKTIFDVIKENVIEGKATIIPVNPSILPYCDYYKEKNWIHWLYCNGYDESKKLVLVEDHVQNGMESTNYRPFKFTSNEVEKLHGSYNQVWVDVPSLDKCFVLDKVSKTKIYDDATFFRELKIIINKFFEKNDDILHIEEIAFLEKDYDLIFSLKHLKTIYNDVFCNLITQNFEINEEVEEIQNLAVTIKNKWDVLARNTKLAQLRKKRVDNNLLVNEIGLIKDLEYKYFSKLVKTI